MSLDSFPYLTSSFFSDLKIEKKIKYLKQLPFPDSIHHRHFTIRAQFLRVSMPETFTSEPNSLFISLNQRKIIEKKSKKKKRWKWVKAKDREREKRAHYGPE